MVLQPKMYLIYLIVLLAVSHAQDPGQAVVVNSCNRSLWYASVAISEPPASELLPGSTYRETFRVYPGPPLPGDIPPGGISIKISEDPLWETDNGSILQFEYTYDPVRHIVWYDLSNVNGDPFLKDGFMLRGESPDCTTILCAPGEDTCHDAYTYPTKSGVLFTCSSNNTLVLTVCLAGSGSQSAVTGTAVSTTPGQSQLTRQNSDTYYTSGQSLCRSESKGSTERTSTLSHSTSNR